MVSKPSARQRPVLERAVRRAIRETDRAALAEIYRELCRSEIPISPAVARILRLIDHVGTPQAQIARAPGTPGLTIPQWAALYRTPPPEVLDRDIFVTIFTDRVSIERYRSAPLRDERTRYLQRCAAVGFSRAVLQRIAANQQRLVGLLDLTQPATVTIARIQDAAETWSRPGLFRRLESGHCPKIRRQFVHHAVAWLRFLGWYDEPPKLPRHPFEAEVAAYAEWARAERGLSEATIESVCHAADQFLVVLAKQKPGAPFTSVHITDVDHAIRARTACGTLSRRTISNYAGRLRQFFRFAESCGLCASGIAAAIKAPRIYANEDLPRGMSRDQALQLLSSTEGDRPADIRDRAVLTLLIVYGLRAGEVRRLRLDDVDWEAETLRVRDRKSGRTDTYPLSLDVAQALHRYIREVRPSRAGPVLFYTIVPPIRPLARGALAGVVQNRVLRLGIVAERHGPHALRHAAAQHLLDQGLSFKEIGDHLGHASPASTGVYARVDLDSLREVAEFDLGDLV